MNKDNKIFYMKGKGVSKRNLLIDRLIEQGVNVEVIEGADEIRGMSIKYMIIDELAKETEDEG